MNFPFRCSALSPFSSKRECNKFLARLATHAFWVAPMVRGFQAKRHFITLGIRVDTVDDTHASKLNGRRRKN